MSKIALMSSRPLQRIHFLGVKRSSLKKRHGKMLRLVWLQFQNAPAVAAAQHFREQESERVQKRQPDLGGLLGAVITNPVNGVRRGGLCVVLYNLGVTMDLAKQERIGGPQRWNDVLELAIAALETEMSFQSLAALNISLGIFG